VGGSRRGQQRLFWDSWRLPVAAALRHRHHNRYQQDVRYERYSFIDGTHFNTVRLIHAHIGPIGESHLLLET
jgi:hypothetical protein